jgi:uncharacterized UBP type Zn finger protein
VAQKAKAKAKLAKVMWVCLHCIQRFCATKEYGKPRGHARTRAIENKHWLATKILEQYCFSCEKDISITMSK